MKIVLLNIIYFIFSVQLCVPIAALERTPCSENDSPTADLFLFTQDYGRNGVEGPKTFSLPNKLEPGSVISVVAKSKTRGTINLLNDDEDSISLHVDARFSFLSNYSLVLNTFTYDWLSEIVEPLQLTSNSKATTTIIYETKGYRIFVNGKEIYFYKHRTGVMPTELQIKQDYIYKVMYSLLSLKNTESTEE